ncbi:MAG: alpha/beta hydrolase fold domain-containing protein [Polyangiaceae bacterium]
MAASNRIESLVGPRVPGLRTLALDVALRLRMKRNNTSGEVTDEGLRRGARRFRKSMERLRHPPFVVVDQTTAGGRPAEWVRVQSDRSASPSPSLSVGPPAPTVSAGGGRVVLYFHGGGFFMSSPVEHRVVTWRVARACKCSVLAVDYRKAPEHAFPAWVEDALAAYDALLALGHAPEDVVVSGDSAGGNIALALAHRLRRLRRPMPGKMLLFSPWADLACEGRSFESNALRDAMFDGASVRALGRYLTRACDPRDPEVSPVNAHFEGFPEMLIFAGSTEVFLDDARTVARRARAAGVRAELCVYRHMPHAFPLFAGVLPLAKTAFDRVETFVRVAG